MRPTEVTRNMRPIVASAMLAVASPPLRQMSLNLQRLPPEQEPSKDGYLSTPREKRRRLRARSRSPTRDDWRGDTIPNISTQMISEPDNFPNIFSKLRHVDNFRREIRIDLLEIVDTLNEADEVHSLLDREFEARCTLEIFIANYEEAQGKTKLMTGEDLWRDQQKCAIQTKCDHFGHSTTHVTLPKPFIIPAEELLVKRRSKTGQDALGLANQYALKVWLESIDSDNFWPPMELQANLDSNGRMAKWLRDGKYHSSDIRVVCKGVLFPEEGAHSILNMELKLGGLRVQSPFSLRLDVQYSLPPKVRLQRRTPDIQNPEALFEPGISAEANSPNPPIRAHRLSSSEAGETQLVKAPEKHVQTYPKPLLLTVPTTERRLCGTDIKNFLAPGEELTVVDSNHETSWRTAKHVSTIEARLDISGDTKEYIIKWNSFITPLRLSSNYYVPQALVAFIKENIDWFYMRKVRIKEFGLHVTSLRLRGIINVECFATCIDLLKDCTDIHNKSEVTKKKVDTTSSDRTTHAEDSTDESPMGQDGINQEAWKVATAYGISVGGYAWNKDATEVGSLFEKVVDGEPALEESMDRMAVDEDGQGMSNPNQVLGEALKKGHKSDVPQLTSEKATNEDLLDDLIYEDASEELEILDIDDYFDAENGGEILLHQPHYLQSYWQSLTQRWPRLKLHPREHFGIATVIAALAIFQGFPNDNIDRLIALHIHHCPSENIQDLVNMYHNANDVASVVPNVFMTERKLHRIMWEAGRETCEAWLTDVYRMEDGTRRTVKEAVETAASVEMWDELWESIASENGG